VTPRPEGDASLWQRAVSFAARVHEHQRRLDGRTPYAAHPCRVALTVTAVFACDDPEAIAIACLHDTIEDGATDYEDLAEAFGEAVADGVAALTKHAALPEARREALYDEALERAGWRAKLVKLADVYDNMSDLAPGAPPSKHGKLIVKAERALSIAARDASGRGELARAIGAVSAKLAAFRADR
jgi:(p)ppGpp synthase/HD superfamily hydrolase